LRIEYHPAVEHDVAEALRFYDSISQRLGDEFRMELQRMVTRAAAAPGRFHLVKPGFRRANLKRFPFHIIFRELPDGIRVTLVRHHRRRPDVGAERV